MLGSPLFATARNWLEISSKCSTSKPHPATPGSLPSHSPQQALGLLTALLYLQGTSCPCHNSLQLLLQDMHQRSPAPAPAVTSLLCSFTISFPVPMPFPVQLYPKSLRHCHPPHLSQACSKNHHRALLLLVSHPPVCASPLPCSLCHCSIPQRKAMISAPQCHVLRIPFTRRSPDHDQPWILHLHRKMQQKSPTPSLPFLGQFLGAI